FLLVSIVQVNAEGFAQTITLSGKNISIETVFKEIRKQTNYSLVCNTDIIKKTPLLEVHSLKTPLIDFLDQVLDGNGLTYVIENKTIAIKRKHKDVAAPVIQQWEIKGTVVDENNTPLEGVSVSLKNSQIAVLSNSNGEYII